MNFTPPANSGIRIESRAGQHGIIIPHGNLGLKSVMPPLIMSLWLIGWGVGFKSALDELLGGDFHPFMALWLAGWSFAGVMVVVTVYQMLRPTVPELLILSRPNLTFDTGVPPFRSRRHYAKNSKRKGMLAKLLFKPQRITFTPDQIVSLTLVQQSKRTRLTINTNNHSIELANSVTDAERQWLYELLKKLYR